jgi:hypothetical protein
MDLSPNSGRLPDEVQPYCGRREAGKGGVTIRCRLVNGVGLAAEPMINGAGRAQRGLAGSCGIETLKYGDESTDVRHHLDDWGFAAARFSQRASDALGAARHRVRGVDALVVAVAAAALRAPRL